MATCGAGVPPAQCSRDGRTTNGPTTAAWEPWNAKLLLRPGFSPDLPARREAELPERCVAERSLRTSKDVGLKFMSFVRFVPSCGIAFATDSIASRDDDRRGSTMFCNAELQHWREVQSELRDRFDVNSAHVCPKTTHASESAGRFVEHTDSIWRWWRRISTRIMLLAQPWNEGANP